MIIIFILLISYMIWHILEITINKYKLVMVFGKKGSGKTCELARYVTEKNKKKWSGGIYSTTYIKGTHIFSARDIGKYTFPPNSLVLIDEIGLEYSNAQGIKGKGMNEQELYWWKYQRHYKVKVIVASQVFNDYLIQLRNLTDQLYFMEDSKLLPGHSVLVRINKNIMVDELTHDVVEGYEIQKLSRRYHYRRKQFKKFDSYERKELPYFPIQTDNPVAEQKETSSPEEKKI